MYQELITKHGDLMLRYDLLDCDVIVCAAMVPSLLTDNFDYQTIDDLIHGVLGNQEVCQHWFDHSNSIWPRRRLQGLPQMVSAVSTFASSLHNAS